MSYLDSKNYQTIESLFMSNPKTFGSLGGYTIAIMDADSELTRAEKEQIALFTSGLNGCEYCIGDHSAVLDNLGIEKPQIKALAKGSFDNSHEKMKPLLSFVKKLTRSSETVSKSDIKKVSNAGWSDQSIEDAICICSLFNLFNRLAIGTGLEGTPETHAQAGKSLSQGYGS